MHSPSETIEAVVLKVDPNEEKISLGMKQTEQDPWMGLPLKYPVGTRISARCATSRASARSSRSSRASTV